MALLEGRSLLFGSRAAIGAVAWRQSNPFET